MISRREVLGAPRTSVDGMRLIDFATRLMGPAATRWLLIGAGLGLAVFCGAGTAAADSGRGASADTTTARTGVTAQPRATAVGQRPVPSKTKAARAVRAASARRVSVTLPPMPVDSGRSFAVSTEAIGDAADEYVAAGGDPADAPRFFFGNLATASLERLAAPSVTAGQVRTDLGNLAVSGYFGGVWLRDNLHATPQVEAPQAEVAQAADLAVAALAIGMFDTLAAGLTGAAAGSGLIATTVAHASVPVLLALYGYNRGYLEFLLENPPAGVASRRDTLGCAGFLGCSSSAFPLELDTRYDAALAKLDSPTTLGWWEMKAWSAVLESATGAGRSVWQAIAAQGGFSPASYQALVDLSSAYLMVSKAAVLSAMLAAADGDADTAAASLRLQAGLWMWSGSYFGGLASGAPAGTVPSIVSG